MKKNDLLRMPFSLKLLFFTASAALCIFGLNADESSEEIFAAAEKGNLSLLRKIPAARFAEVHLHTGMTPLMAAASEGHSEAVRIILKKRNNANEKDKSGMTALMHACERDHTDAAEVLFQYGADADITDDDYNTALNHSVWFYSLKCMKLLLKQKAKTDVKEQQGNNAVLFAALPVHKASDEKSLEAVKLLLSYGADIRSLNEFKDTVLMNAVIAGNRKTAVFLLRQGVPVNAVNAAGRTALILSVLYGRPDITEDLVKNGSDIEIRDKNGKTALDYARERSDSRLIRILGKK